ncbi:MAG: hypothetical protein JXA79_07655, partial [Deltaproteobacteria bacterium]|nr:hypothetical protein [Deltaproteobacteria bacterium]
MKKKGYTKIGLLFIMTFMLITGLTESLSPGKGFAAIPEPDVIFKGTAVRYGDLVTDVISVKLTDTHEVLDSYVIGTNPKYGAEQYVLKVSMEYFDSIEGKLISFYFNDVAVPLAGGILTMQLPKWGTIVPLDLIIAMDDIDGDGMDDNWEMAFFGTLDRDGQGDMNSDGESDFTESELGQDPTEAWWDEVDDTTVTTCVNNEIVLQNALTAATGDGKHNIIKVRQGTYHGNFFYRALPEEDFDLELIGGYIDCNTCTREEDPRLTVLDGDVTGDSVGDNPTIVLDAAKWETSGSIRIRGFHIKNGSSLDKFAGGLHVAVYTGEAEVIGNWVDLCCSAVDGGGMKVFTVEGSAKVVNNTLINNEADKGGGLSM